MRSPRHEDWDAQLLRQRCQPVNVIAMLVRDQNRGERMRILSQRLQALESLAAGDAGVHQDAGRGTGHERAIAAAPRSQHRDTYTHGLQAYP